MGFSFPICEDPEQKVATAYGAVKESGGIQRCVLVVNKQGKVTWSQEGLPATEEILAALDAQETNDPNHSRLSSS